MNLIAPHFRIQGERQDLSRRRLGTGKTAWPQIEVGIGALEMNRDRVMDAAANPRVLKCPEHSIAITMENTHDEEVIDVLDRPGGRVR